MFNYISPYRRDKNIGKAINDAIEKLNITDDEWIILTDQDVLWLMPDTKANLESVLEKTPFDLLGCKTNRVGLKHHLYNSYIAKHSNMRQHIAIADFLWAELGGMITPLYSEDIAGFMMAFRKSTWLEAGKFIENSLQFDKQFTRSCRKKRKRIGILEGIYVFHLYRFTADDPIAWTKHLKQ